MNSVIMERLPRVEGVIRVILSQKTSSKSVFLQSGRSTHLESKLINRYPLEAIHLTQGLSEKLCISHAVAAVSALEDYLQLYPTETALRIRQVLLQLSAIQSHIHHFYWEVLPDYLNVEHFTEQNLTRYIGIAPKAKTRGDLSNKIGTRILKNVGNAMDVLNTIQKALALLGGKYPVIMNQIPGGLTNFSISRSVTMDIVRKLEQIKTFVEVLWPNDIKAFIKDNPGTVTVLEKNSNLISFGSLVIEKDKGKSSYYSDGVLLDRKVEPVNELKITESLHNTFYKPVDKNSGKNAVLYDLKKPKAETWIKGARYEDEPMITGALSRMLVTHFGGGNLEISDRVGQLTDDLGLSSGSPNCIASRLLAEVFEGRFYLKNVLKNLMELKNENDTISKSSYNFSREGVGVGKIESPAGSLMHQIYISKNRITQYRIVSPMNWNLSPSDETGKSGVVEKELNRLLDLDKLTTIQVCRLLHSYNINALDGTQ